MSSTLVLGLGSSLMGDDGVGCAVAERLIQDPRLPRDVMVVCAGTDLLRWAEEMERHQKVVLVDAILGTGEPGSVAVYRDDFVTADDRQWNVHHLSVSRAIRMLQIANPRMGEVSFLLLAVTIESVEMGEGLSAGLASRIPSIVDAVLAVCAEAP